MPLLEFFPLTALLLLALQVGKSKSEVCPPIPSSIPSELIRILKNSQNESKKLEISDKIAHQTFVLYNLERRLKLLERRLKSVVQPIWKVVKGGSAWSQCNTELCQSIIPDRVFDHLTNLEHLSLRKNKVSHIANKSFESLSNLKTLDLAMNNIRQIDLRAFQSLDNLRELRLGHNSLTRLSSGIFGNLGQLRRLMLFSNHITHLEENIFVGLHQVTILSLNNNLLKFLHPSVFEPMTKLTKLRLDWNELHFLPSGCLDKIPQLSAVKLGENPWHCDCRAIYLARWLRSSSSQLWNTEPLCKSPEMFEGQSLGMLRFDNLCRGQWAAMINLFPRLPIRKQHMTASRTLSDVLRQHSEMVAKLKIL
ncbi:leucine-rich repeat-containing protein 15 [Sergentomyia squamirostris]